MALGYLIASLAATAFVIAVALTLLIRRLAPVLGFVDKPGHRKIHAAPTPLGGGVAIFLAVALPILAGLGVVHIVSPERAAALFGSVADYWTGIRQQTPLALKFLAAVAAMHLLGLADDRRALGPYVKLFAQLAIVGGLVLWTDLRALTALGPAASVIITVLWIVGITNAFNFLDNMDGLSAGVGAVCSAAFLAATLAMPEPQWFVAAVLALLIGALAGFLCFNFAPASIFMGDSGSLLIGMVLGVLTVRTQYLRPDVDLSRGWYAVFAPVIVLALPLYDLVVVSAIRLSRGRSPFVGDTNHFSHRLVARGMSRRTAVLCIWLITAATSLGAVLLPHVPPGLAALIFAQTMLVLAVVMLLEQHPLPPQQVEAELGKANEGS